MNQTGIAFLDDLVAELVAIGPTDLLEPQQDEDDEVGFHQLGIMPIELQRLWTVIMRRRQRCKELVSAGKEAFLKEDKAELDRLEREFKNVDFESTQLRKIFWREIEALDPEGESRAQGVRAGWRYGWVEQKDEKATGMPIGFHVLSIGGKDLEGMLAQMLGGRAN